MPIPLSITSICTVYTPSSTAVKRASRRTLPPSGVNFTALESRFVIICISLLLSPIRVWGILSFRCTEKYWRFSSIWKLMILTAFWIILSKTKLSRDNSSLFVSIFDISRMSLMTPCKWMEASSIFFRQYSLRSIFSDFLAMAVMPIIAFSGVRISWLMSRRNSDFAAFAISAPSRARSMSVTSLKTTMVPSLPVSLELIGIKSMTHFLISVLLLKQTSSGTDRALLSASTAERLAVIISIHLSSQIPFKNSSICPPLSEPASAPVSFRRTLEQKTIRFKLFKQIIMSELLSRRSCK